MSQLFEIAVLVYLIILSVYAWNVLSLLERIIAVVCAMSWTLMIIALNLRSNAKPKLLAMIISAVAVSSMLVYSILLNRNQQVHQLNLVEFSVIGIALWLLIIVGKTAYLFIRKS